MANIGFLLGTLALVGAPGVIAATIRLRDCSFSVPAASGDTCRSMAADWNISEDQFTLWNAGVNCGALVAGKEYCVEWVGPEPVVTTAQSSTTSKATTTSAASTTSKATTTSAASTTTSAAPVPTDNMPDIVSNCDKFYKIVSGDTCASIEFNHGITDADFKKWNPYITSTCTNLWLDYKVCVGVPGTTTSKPSTTKPTTTTSAVPVPTDNMPNTVSNCNKFYKIVSGDSCATIESAKGVTDADFKKWNPYIDSACSNLWLGYNVCVGVPGSLPVTSSTSQTTTTPTGTGPSPTQTGIVTDCQKYHKAVSGDSCQIIVDKYRTFSVADFYKWNPAVGSSCSSLLIGYNYCIAVKGTPTTPPPTTPTPVQGGISSRCNKWHLVSSGDVCQSIADKYKISTSNFYSWNPAVGNTCSSLWLGYYVCVGSS